MMSSSLAETYDILRERIASFPEGHNRKQEVITAHSIDMQQLLYEILQYEPQFTQLHRLQVDNKIFLSSRPIAVRIYREGDLFFAENDNLVVCGTGSKVQEALQDLCLHIHHFFEYYGKMDKGKLMGDGLRLKELYKDLLVEEKYAGR